jgi:hypothetical protein
VGRTARGTEGHGKALLFLMPEELGFLRYLKQSKVLPSILYLCVLNICYDRPFRFLWHLLWAL